MKTITRNFVLYMLVLFVVFTQVSYAVPFYWMGGSQATANWSITGNWSTTGFGGPTAGTLPGATDDVLFPTGVSVTFTTQPTAFTIQSIQLQGTSVVFFNGGTMGTPSILTLQGGASSVAGAAPGQLLMGGWNSLVMNGGSLVLNGNTQALFLNGNPGGITLNGAAALTVAFGGGIGTIYNGTINLNGTSTMTVNGTIALGDGTSDGYLNVGATSTVTIAGSGSIVANNTIPVGITVNGLIDIAGFCLLNNMSTFNLSAGATLRTTRADGFNGTVPSGLGGGAIQRTGSGTATYVAGANYIIDVVGASQLNLGAVAGKQAITDATNFTVIINGGGVTAQMNSPLTLSGALNVSGTGQLDMLSGASLNLNGGGSQISSTLGIDVRSGATLVNSAGLTIQTGSVVVVGGVTAAISGVPINYAIGSRLQYSMGGDRTLLGNTEFPAIMNGDVTLTNGAGNIVTLNGTKTINGALNISSGILRTGGSNSLTLGYVGANSIDATGALEIGSIGVPTSGLFLTNGVALTNDGLITINDGSAAIDNFLEIQGTGSISGAGSVTYSATNTALRYTGGGNIAAGQELPAANGPENLIMSKTGGTSVTLPGTRSLPATGILTLTSGILNTASFQFDLNNPAVGALVGGAFNSNTMIRGVFHRATSAAGAYLFPVGRLTTYLPVTANVPAVVGTINVSAFDYNSAGTGDGTTLLPTLSNTEFWQISGSGIAGVTLDFARFTPFPAGARLGATMNPMGPSTGYSAVGNALASSGPTLSSTPLTIGAFRYYAAGDIPPTTYTWNNAGGAWTTPGNWLPARTTPLPNDILQFDPAFGTPAGNITVNSIPTQTIGKLIINRALAAETVTLQGAAPTLTVQGVGAAPHVAVQSGMLDMGTLGLLSLGSATTQMRVFSGATLVGNGPPMATNQIGGTGFFTLDAGATLYANRRPINGTLLTCSGAGSTFDNAANYIFNPIALSAGFAASGALPAIVQANNITLLGGTTTLNSDVTVNGTFDATLGSFSIGAGVTMTLAKNAPGNAVGMGQTLNVAGTLVIQDNSAISGAGSVLYSGSGDLQYTGTVAAFPPTGIELPTPTMNRPVTINNTQGVNGGITLSFPTYFSSLPALALTSGLVKSSAAAKATFTSSQLPVGASAVSYIDGPMEILATFSGGNFFFPIGSGGQFLPIRILPTTGNGTLEAEAFPVNSGGTSGTGIGSLGNEYWRVQQTSGMLYSSAVVNLNRPSAIPAGSSVGFNNTTTSGGMYNGQGGTVATGITSNAIPNPFAATNRYFAIGGTPPTTFYYFSGAAENPANWTGNINGMGGAAANFAGSGAVFYVPAGRTATFTGQAIFALGTILQVESGGAITVQSGITLTANGSFRINAGGRLTLQGTGAVVAPSGVQYIAPTATLEYSGTTNRLTSDVEFPPAFPASLVVTSGSVRLNSSKAIAGSFTLTDGSVDFSIANRLRLSGAATFSNSAFVSDSTDTLLITGSGLIRGSVGITQLAQLTIQRGGQTLALAGTTRITQQLNLLGGNLSLLPNESVILQSSADTALVGGNSSAFVSGALVRRWRANLTPQTAPPMFYPIGRGGTYLPVTLTEATTGTLAPDVAVEAFNTGSGGTPALGVPGALSTSEYWRVDALNGNFTGAKVGVLRAGSFTASNTLAAGNSQTGLYTSVGGVLSPLAQGTSLLSDAVSNSGTRFYAIVGALPIGPRITGFSPSIGGQAGTMIITGTNLTSVNVVAVGGVPVQSFTVLNSTTISVVLGAVATGPVQIGSPLGGVASDSSFTFVPSPTISSVFPNPAGVGALITIGGSNLGGLNGLTIGGVVIPQNGITTNPDGTFSARIPSTATTSTIIISTPGGTVISTNALTLVAAPTLTGFSPAVASTGAVITLTGENFVQGVQILFGTVFAPNVTVNSSSRMTVIVPAQAAPVLSALLDKGSGVLTSSWVQSVFLTIRTGGGTVTSATQFVYSSTPGGSTGIDPLRLVVLSEAREKIAALGGRVRITGANLELIQELTLRTSVGSTRASFILSSSALMTLLIPTTGLLRGTNATVSSALVTVDALGAYNRAVVSDFFTVVGFPVIRSISPIDAGAGEEVRVRGENLDLINDWC